MPPFINPFFLCASLKFTPRPSPWPPTPFPRINIPLDPELARPPLPFLQYPSGPDRGPFHQIVYPFPLPHSILFWDALETPWGALFRLAPVPCFLLRVHSFARCPPSLSFLFSFTKFPAAYVFGPLNFLSFHRCLVVRHHPSILFQPPYPHTPGASPPPHCQFPLMACLP